MPVPDAQAPFPQISFAGMPTIFYSVPAPETADVSLASLLELQRSARDATRRRFCLNERCSDGLKEWTSLSSFPRLLWIFLCRKSGACVCIFRVDPLSIPQRTHAQLPRSAPAAANNPRRAHLHTPRSSVHCWSSDQLPLLLCCKAWELLLSCI